MIEDWHTSCSIGGWYLVSILINFQVIFILKVIWKYFYNNSSARDHCALYQIKNLINQTNVSKTPKHRFNACDDFLEIVMTGHILSAALKAFGMKTLTDQPSKTLLLHLRLH